MIVTAITSRLSPEPQLVPFRQCYAACFYKRTDHDRETSTALA